MLQQKVQDRLAFPKEEIIGANVYELFSKNFAGLVMDHVRKCFETRDLAVPSLFYGWR